MKPSPNHRSPLPLATRPALLALALLALSGPAPAQKPARGGPPQWHGDIARFHEHDWTLWRGGHWSQGRHEGRHGWWWVVGANWYFYPAPVYPCPSPWEPPTATFTPMPPATQYWYYCEASRAYYPYVPSCPAGWTQVPATPANTAPTMTK